MLNQRLEDLCETGVAAGGMALITGVPGVGKTLLARKFAEDAVSRRGALTVRFLSIHASMLAEEVPLFMAMARALRAEEAGRRILSEHGSRSAGLAALLDASRQAGLWHRRALLLLVDEIQSVQPQPVGMRTLRTLHQGRHRCPILLLGMGTQHAEDALANPADGSAGICVAAPIRLGPLSHEEALEAVRRNMAALGQEIGEANVVALASASRGFPQHLHGYLLGALEAIAKHGSLEADGALAWALKLGEQRNLARLRDLLQRLGGTWRSCGPEPTTTTREGLPR